MSDWMPAFVPGLTLSERYYWDAVRPVLDRALPGLRHSAALIGYGSDVIGCDTPMSRDHMWGPRAVLFLPEEGFAEARQAVDVALREGLPHRFWGYPTSFTSANSEGTRWMTLVEDGPVDHLVFSYTIREYFDRELGKDRWKAPATADWLTFSEHRLLTLTSGKVFHDDLGLEEIRARLSYYPNDVWLYLLACEWQKIGQEEPFVGRTGDSGDDLGSRIVTARLAQSAMRLAFLMERRYPPYSKWFGTVFGRLGIALKLKPHLDGALTAATWQDREAHLGRAYEILAEEHNRLSLTEPVETRCSPFHERPFQIIHADEIAGKLRGMIADEGLRKLTLYGSVNQISNSTDFLEDAAALGKVRGLYR